jgi:hypothetical protein
MGLLLPRRAGDERGRPPPPCISLVGWAPRACFPAAAFLWRADC